MSADNRKRDAAALYIPDGKRATGRMILCFAHATPMPAAKAVAARVAPDFDVDVCPNARCAECKKAFSDGAVLVRNAAGAVCHARCSDTNGMPRCLCHSRRQSPCALVKVRAWPHFDAEVLCPGQQCHACSAPFKHHDKVRLDASEALVHVECTAECVFCRHAVSKPASSKVTACADCYTTCADCGADITPVWERVPTFDKTVVCLACYEGKRDDDDDDARVQWLECGAACRTENHKYTWTHVTDDKRNQERAVVCNKLACNACHWPSRDSRRIWYGDRKGIIVIDGAAYCGNGSCVRLCSMCSKYINGAPIGEDDTAICDECPSCCVECDASFQGDPDSVVMVGERPLCSDCAAGDDDSDSGSSA